ncbi:DUF4346 domain-containing protein [Candidatus Woesearchaeota archaeon]|nr:DUF4346 domain-containing protein [Candidatus Woesearchaeota archaeon]
MHPNSQKPQISEDAEYIEGSFHKYKDWAQDPKGYFPIRVNKEKKLIELGFCKKDNIIETVITGEMPQEIYYTAIKKGLISRMEHAAYLGKELEKAYLALKHNLEYVQDDELKL